MSQRPEGHDREITTHRAVVARDVLGLAELREDVLREHLAELDAHLVCARIRVSRAHVEGAHADAPKELMPQTTPCVKILCS